MRSRPVFRQGSGLLFGLLVAVCVVADEPEGLQLVNGFLNDVRSLTAEFEQTLINADGEVLEESAGTLALNRPGQFRWLYAVVVEEVFLSKAMATNAIIVRIAKVISTSRIE
jgi:outer membrane lipoprotein carrier protein